MEELGLTLDMTECNNLIAVRLSCVDSTRILWPKDSVQRLIPFGCFGDEENRNEWENIVSNKQINVKFVLLKVTCNPTDIMY